MCLHAVVVGMILLIHVLLRDPQTTLLLGGILCFPLYVYLGVSEARRTTLRLNPLSYYLLWYSIGLGLSPVYINSVLTEKAGLPFSIVVIPPDAVATGYVLFLIGSLSFHIGIQARRPRPGQRGKYASERGSNPLPALILLYVVGLVTVWKTEWIAFLGAPARLLQWGSVAAIAAVALLPSQRLGLSNRAQAVFIALGTLGALIANMMSFSKSYIMFAFVPVLWRFYLRQDLRRWFLPLLMGIAALYLTIVAPAINSARYTQLQEGETAFARVSRAVLSRLGGDEGSSAPVDASDQGAQFLSRMYDPIATAYIVTEVERTGLLMGETIAYLKYAFIPRILWRDKPTVTRGAWFAYYIGFSESEEKSTTSLGITATGELYWNFGTLGIVLGMFLLGLMNGALWRMAGDDPRDTPFHMLLYTIVMLTLPNMSEAVTVFTATIIAYLTIRVAHASTSALAGLRSVLRASAIRG